MNLRAVMAKTKKMKVERERERLVGERRNQRLCVPSSVLYKSDNDLEVFTKERQR